MDSEIISINYDSEQPCGGGGGERMTEEEYEREYRKYVFMRDAVTNSFSRMRIQLSDTIRTLYNENLELQIRLAAEEEKNIFLNEKIRKLQSKDEERRG